MSNLIDLDFIEIQEGTVMKYVEAQTIEWGIKKTRYNQYKAAKLLGISRGCMRMKLKEYFPGKYIK